MFKPYTIRVLKESHHKVLMQLLKDISSTEDFCVTREQMKVAHELRYTIIRDGRGR